MKRTLPITWLLALSILLGSANLRITAGNASSFRLARRTRSQLARKYGRESGGRVSRDDKGASGCRGATTRNISVFGQGVCVDRWRNLLDCGGLLRRNAPSEAGDFHRRRDGRRVSRQQFRHANHRDVAELEGATQTANVRILECGAWLSGQAARHASRSQAGNNRGQCLARCRRTC
jgi:hypothetical protein